MFFIVSLEVFPYDVAFLLGETDEKAKSAFKGFELGLTESEYEEYFTLGKKNGTASMFPCGATMVRTKVIPKTPDEFGILQHEITHIVFMIMERMGVELKIPYSDEAYTYTIEYLTKKSYQKIFAAAKKKN